MAKIILVSEHVTPTSWQLAQALRAQQHDVVLLTSYGEEPPEDSPIEIMAYFKRWSFLESFRLIPGLFGLQPQILHLVLSEDEMNPAQMLLSAFAKSHPNCVLTTSLLNIKRGFAKRTPIRYLVEESDIITCPTVEGLGQLRGLDVRSPRQGRGILAPVMSFTNDLIDENLIDLEEARLTEALQGENYYVVPFQESHFQPESECFERIRMLAQKHKVVLWGSYDHWSLRERKKFAAWMEEFGCGHNWVLTGGIPLSRSRQLLESSLALVLAGQKLSPVEVTEYYIQVIQIGSTLILDSHQASVHSNLWKNGINCWVLDVHHLNQDLLSLLKKSHLHLPEKLSADLTRERQLIDSSMNELNRLYNRALNQLR